MDKPDVFQGMLVETEQPTPQSYLELASQFGLSTIHERPQQGLILSVDDLGLGLKDVENPKQTPVRAEFISAEMQYRLKQSGPKSELIMRAIGNKQAPWHVLDATPGLGRDAMVMATFGCRVTMLERSNVVAALLADSLRQLAIQNPELREKLSLYQGDSIDLLTPAQLKQRHIQIPDIVYLDPMFPHRKKSALVKKEMQLFQRLLGHDPDADSLFLAAMGVAKKRVVVKRPNSAPALNNQTPNMQIKSKKHRFDVYLTQ